MNTITKITAVFWLGVALCSTAACNMQQDYTDEIMRIDALAARLDSASKVYATLETDTLSAMRNTIEGHLEYIQRNFRGAMRKDIGEHASRYKTTRKLLEQTENNILQGREECNYTLLQLKHLKQALAEHATHDAQGNKMDKEYVAKALGRETEEAGKLISALALIQNNAMKAKDDFLKQSPKMQYWTDSIPPIKAEAQNIK